MKPTGEVLFDSASRTPLSVRSPRKPVWVPYDPPPRTARERAARAFRRYGFGVACAIVAAALVGLLFALPRWQAARRSPGQQAAQQQAAPALAEEPPPSSSPRAFSFTLEPLSSTAEADGDSARPVAAPPQAQSSKPRGRRAVPQRAVPIREESAAERQARLDRYVREVKARKQSRRARLERDVREMAAADSTQ